MPLAELLGATLIDAAEGIASGSISSVALTEAALERAQQLQGSINAFVRIDAERALAQARAADAAVARGAPLGPLHGVPLAHKDMYYEAGQVSNCGSRIRSGFIADRTATLLARLTAAGAVNLGTLNMTEFALGPTGHNAVWGHCRNPWNPAYIAAGSSSGSGAAVAARVAFGSLGSDTGGSIRLPASANGVVGLKPTYARLSRAHSMGLSFSIDTPGIIARTALDCARLLAVTAGYDPHDPTCSRRSVPDYEALARRPLQSLRIGVPANYFFDRVSADVDARLQAALEVLRGAGAKTFTVECPRVDTFSELSRVIVYSEAAAIHGEWLRSRGDEYSPQVRVRLATGFAIPAPVYLDALRLRGTLVREFVRAVFRDCDVLFTPTMSIPAPTIAETDVGGGEAMWEIIGRLVHCTAPFNYLGLPALSVPIGFDAHGVPTSMQLAGPPFAESRLLQLAAVYQQHTQWHASAPP